MCAQFIVREIDTLAWQLLVRRGSAKMGGDWK